MAAILESEVSEKFMLEEEKPNEVRRQKKTSNYAFCEISVTRVVSIRKASLSLRPLENLD